MEQPDYGSNDDECHPLHANQAMRKLLLAIQEEPSAPLPYRFLAACYPHMGQLDDARETAVRLRAITSVVVPDDSNLRNAEDREFFLSELAHGGRRGDMSQSRRLAAIRVSLERRFETASHLGSL